MAGGGALSHEKTKRGATSKRKKKKRVGFVLDMTPLVDITFLLLTFFMFTTTMATPQVMEMSIPPESDKKIDVRCQELLSIIIDDDGDIYWYVCDDPAEKIEIKDVAKIAARENLRPEVMNKLITVLKVSDNAPYGTVVNILDELNLAEMAIISKMSKQIGPDGQPLKRQRRFTIAKYEETDREKLIEEGLINGNDSND